MCFDDLTTFGSVVAKYLALAVGPMLGALVLWFVADWIVAESGRGSQTAPMRGLTMTVEDCCNGGRRLIFHVPVGQRMQTMMVESRFDGSDASVLVEGKPNGETMALNRVDERRTTTVFERNGKVFRKSTTVSQADRIALTVENEFIDTGDE